MACEGHVMNISESLQSFANRTGVTVEYAYRFWHAHGEAIAKRWQAPFSAIDPNGDSVDHVTIAGGRCFGLTVADIRAIGR